MVPVHNVHVLNHVVYKGKNIEHISDRISIQLINSKRFNLHEPEALYLVRKIAGNLMDFA